MKKLTTLAFIISIGTLSGCTTVHTVKRSISNYSSSSSYSSSSKNAEYDRLYAQLPTETRQMILEHVPYDYIHRTKYNSSNAQEAIKAIVDYAQIARIEKEAKAQAERDRQNREANKKVDCDNPFELDLLDLIPATRLLRMGSVIAKAEKVAEARRRGLCK